MGRPPQEPLRPLSAAERAALAQLARAASERADRVTRAKLQLAVAAGASFTAAAHTAGRRNGAAVARLVARFNREGLAAVTPRYGGGPPVQYGAAERARILAEFHRAPDREQDGTATWSLTTLQRALRRAPDGLPTVSTATILAVLWEARYTWQQTRTWCHTGTARRRRRDGTVVPVHDPLAPPQKDVIERAYRVGEACGLQVWCQDAAGPYQAIPQPGAAWHLVGDPARQPHEYVRGGTAKLLTLFRPATGAVRAEPVDRTTNAVLHEWLRRELAAIVAACPPAPQESGPGQRWEDWLVTPQPS